MHLDDSVITNRTDAAFAVSDPDKLITIHRKTGDILAFHLADAQRIRNITANLEQARPFVHYPERLARSIGERQNTVELFPSAVNTSKNRPSEK